jgi:uncharacterized protein (DUF342 family)
VHLQQCEHMKTKCDACGSKLTGETMRIHTYKACCEAMKLSHVEKVSKLEAKVSAAEKKCAELENEVDSLLKQLTNKRKKVKAESRETVVSSVEPQDEYIPLRERIAKSKARKILWRLC